MLQSTWAGALIWFESITAGSRNQHALDVLPITLLPG